MSDESHFVILWGHPGKELVGHIVGERKVDREFLGFCWTKDEQTEGILMWPLLTSGPNVTPRSLLLAPAFCLKIPPSVPTPLPSLELIDLSPHSTSFLFSDLPPPLSLYSSPLFLLTSGLLLPSPSLLLSPSNDPNPDPIYSNSVTLEKKRISYLQFFSLTPMSVPIYLSEPGVAYASYLLF